MNSEAFDSTIAPLRALGGQRVWSLMVSLFGDLVQGPDDVIDGPVLSTILDRLQIKPAAQRVALHRLRNDGWIRSAKSGRISQHRLTENGRAESAAASARIYAAPPDAREGWQLVLVESPDRIPPNDLAAAGFTQIAPRMFVGKSSAVPPDGGLSLTGGSVPVWLQTQAEPAALRAGYAGLHETLTEIARSIPDRSRLTALESAALRCLIVHNWRRLVLKHPELPGALIPADWPGLGCHRLVHDLLARFPRPRLRDITPERAAA